MNKFFILALFLAPFLLAGCSVNPATGKSQFTALLSPQQEMEIGAGEHQKIIKQFGIYDNAELAAYVNNIGQNLVQYTERPGIAYRFFILDTPMVNAFALPGGYIYITRGLMALADNEAELASVLAHEIGHVTGRHAAERYSQNVLTSLGTVLISSAIDKAGVSQALGLGSELFMKSYSRDQEREADMLGIRYAALAGYDPGAMENFLRSMGEHAQLRAQIEGRANPTSASYFSTHPATAERVQNTRTQAQAFAANNNIRRDEYLNMIDGITYGDSARHGFIRGQTFYHPQMAFTFTAPDGYRLNNQPTQITATSTDGVVMIFDFASNPDGMNVHSYLTQRWMAGQNLPTVEVVTVNGMPAATTAFSGRVGGKAATIRIMAIEWSDNRFARFQIAIPSGVSADTIEALKKTTYSLRRLSDEEIKTLKPLRLKVITAQGGQSLSAIARRQPFTTLQQERFRVLNSIPSDQGLMAGNRYKLVTN